MVDTYDNLAFDSQVGVFVQPDLDSRLCLEELEDQELQVREHGVVSDIDDSWILTIGLIMSR